MLHGYQKPLSGEKVGVVFGSFAPLHQGHLDCIMRAKKENAVLHVKLKIEYVSPETAGQLYAGFGLKGKLGSGR